MIKFDDIDKEIVEMLEKDSRTTYRDIQDELGISIGTVYNRITKLNENGVIEKYTIDIFREALLNPLGFLDSFYEDLNSLIEKQDQYSKKGFTQKLIRLSEIIPKYIALKGAKKK